MQQTDFLVIGSGIGGLTYALKVARQFTDKKVLVITKAAEDETNTKCSVIDKFFRTEARGKHLIACNSGS